jgi:hypothetical protein
MPRTTPWGNLPLTRKEQLQQLGIDITELEDKFLVHAGE